MSKQIIFYEIETVASLKQCKKPSMKIIEKEIVEVPAFMSMSDFPLFPRSPFKSCLLAILASTMPEAFMAWKSVRLDIASAASISTHCPVSCFFFQRSTNLKHASLLHEIAQKCSQDQKKNSKSNTVTMLLEANNITATDSCSFYSSYACMSGR